MPRKWCVCRWRRKASFAASLRRALTGGSPEPRGLAHSHVLPPPLREEAGAMVRSLLYKAVSAVMDQINDLFGPCAAKEPRQPKRVPSGPASKPDAPAKVLPALARQAWRGRQEALAPRMQAQHP